MIVDSSRSDGTEPCGSITWRNEILKHEKPTLEIGMQLKFSDWLIPKFSTLARGLRLEPERLQKMIVRNSMTLAEKNLFTEMLFNREAALACDFSEVGRVKRKVASPQKIRTVEHTAWQVPGFRIP